MTAEPILRLEGIDKHFGATQALRSASLTVRPNSIHALLGENGAGKTTLMRIAFGLLQPDAGTIRIDGGLRTFASPADALRAGLAMVHQHFSSIDSLTVAENVALGGRGRFELAGVRTRIRELAIESGLALDPDALTSSLPVSARQRLEIVRALARRVRLLILDEPTAVLAPGEVTELLAVLRRFADGGGSVVIITHKLREALSAANFVTVLRQGATVAELEADGATETQLTSLMLGTSTTPTTPPNPRPAHRGPVVLSASNLHVRDERGLSRVRNVSVDFRSNEIVGLAGVEGSGARELLRALANVLPVESGSIARPRSLGFVPEDRQHEALILDFLLYENVALRDAGSAHGRIPWPAWAERTDRLMRRFDVRAPNSATPTTSLSGGNQQKLVMARELETTPAALIIENPTRGLDIMASASVHDEIRASRDAGTAIVLHTADLDELLALADRVLVMFGGRAFEVARDRDRIGRTMLGVLDH